jgi:hypothetical protein
VVTCGPDGCQVPATKSLLSFFRAEEDVRNHGAELVGSEATESIVDEKVLIQRPERGPMEQDHLAGVVRGGLL